MEKVYIEAKYRIPGFVSNNGYICIYDNSIKGVFTLDCASIEIKGGKLHFYLAEYDIDYHSYKNSTEFVARTSFNYLESPYTYTLKSNSNVTLSLELIRRITNPIEILEISKNFKYAFPK